MQHKNATGWTIAIVLILLLNTIPLAGLMRSLPIPSEEGAAPLGSLFPNTPLYTTQIFAGDILATSIWAAERSDNAENVYDLKPRTQYGDQFPYPPLMLFLGKLFAPLGPFSYYPWAMLLLAGIAIMAVLANKILQEKGVGKNERIVAIILLVCAQGVIRNLGWGHYYLFVIPLALGIAWYENKNEWIAGACWGILTSFLLYGFIFFPLFFLRRRWKSIAIGTGIIATPYIALFFYSPASFYGFFPFLAGASTLGLMQTGAFSLVRILPESLRIAYLAIHAVLFGIITIAFWRSRINTYTYIAFMILFLLITEPWFSGHHTITALIAMVLLYRREMILPYLLLETNLQTFTGIENGGSFILTGIFFTACFGLYVYTLWDAYRSLRGQQLYKPQKKAV